MEADKKLGVSEHVLFNELVIWCHHMVFRRKKDGSTRNISPLKKRCKSNTCASEVKKPFKLAHKIKNEISKTATDALNEYHKVPLRKSESHLTKFVIPYGMFRYTSAP